MNYNVKLDSVQLTLLSRELWHYAESFEHKVEIFLNRLADVAIEVAVMNGGDYGQFITYTKKLENGTTITVTGRSRPIAREWYAGSNSKQTRTEYISPILMAEFGSGFYAINDKSGLGGQGTLNKYGHANDPDGWYWYADSTNDSEATPVSQAKSGKIKFHSMGVHPARPLHKAVLACIEQVREIAQEVFG